MVGQLKSYLQHPIATEDGHQSSERRYLPRDSIDCCHSLSEMMPYPNIQPAVQQRSLWRFSMARLLQGMTGFFVLKLPACHGTLVMCWSFHGVFQHGFGLKNVCWVPRRMCKKNTKNEIKKATIYRDHAHQTGRKKNILSQPGQPIVQ